MRLSNMLFRCLLFTIGPLSLFVIVAPRTLLERVHVYAWSWLLLLPPVLWLGEFIRGLHRGGE